MRLKEKRPPECPAHEEDALSLEQITDPKSRPVHSITDDFSPVVSGGTCHLSISIPSCLPSLHDAET